MLTDGNEPEADAAAPEVQQEHQEQQQAQQHEVTVQQMPISLHKEIEVQIRVKNITREGLSVLEKAYTQWAEWQHQIYQQGYPPEHQLLSGSLSLDVAELNSNGRVVWQDTVAPVPGTGKPQANRAAAYEEVEAPPLYDRGIDELLAPPAVPGSGGISMLPGGAEATRRRQMAEARLSLDECGDTPGALPTKRKRLAANRCFNCGSYAHGIAQCPKEYDAARVIAARAERGAVNGGSAGVAALMRQRYFQGGGKGGDKPAPFEGIKPGCISAELAAAVGMRSQTTPPPWLCRMAALGLPPRWVGDTPAAGLAAEDVIAFVNGSDDETEPAAATQEAEEENESSRDDSSGPADSADADFVPIGEQHKQQPDATEHAASAEQQQPQPNTDAGTAEDAAVPESNRHASANGTLAAAAVAAAAAAGGVSVGSGNALAHFPGINGPLPEGADPEQWQAELDRGSSVRHMLGVR